MLRNERVESAQGAESSGTDEADPSDPVAAAYADQSSEAGITQEQFNCVRPRPPESDQLRKILNRLRPLISRVAALTAEKKSARAKWKTEGGAAIHRINQRLPPADNAKHPDEDDLAGRIVAEMERGGEPWEIVSLPAEAEAGDLLGRTPGQWLWDDAYGYAGFLRHEKATQLPRNWSALYQQRPAPETGDYFKDEWFRTYASEPPRQTLNVYGGSDYAVTSHGGDYTVHVVVGVDPDNRMYLLDLWRAQASSDVWIEAWCDLVRKWRPALWAEENGQIISGVGPFCRFFNGAPSSVRPTHAASSS